MSTVKQKYLKDENGDIFSPVVSAKSVYKNNVNVDSVLSWVGDKIIGFWGENSEKLHRAVIFFGGNGKTSEDIQLPIQGVNKIVAIIGCAYNESTSQALPFGFYSGAGYYYTCFATKTTISFRCTNDYIHYNRYVILYYI